MKSSPTSTPHGDETLLALEAVRKFLADGKPIELNQANRRT